SSPSRQASIGMAAGRVVVPSTCSASRSNSRKGSVRISMVCHSLQIAAFLLSTQPIYGGWYIFLIALRRGRGKPDCRRILEVPDGTDRRSGEGRVRDFRCRRAGGNGATEPAPL